MIITVLNIDMNIRKTKKKRKKRIVKQKRNGEYE